MNSNSDVLWRPQWANMAFTIVFTVPAKSPKLCTIRTLFDVTANAISCSVTTLLVTPTAVTYIHQRMNSYIKEKFVGSHFWISTLSWSAQHCSSVRVTISVHKPILPILHSFNRFQCCVTLFTVMQWQKHRIQLSIFRPRTLILLKTLAPYKPFTYLLTYLLTYMIWWNTIEHISDTSFM